MKNPKLIRLWLEEFDGEQALRADFDSDRHHRVVIQPPYSADKVSDALMILARNIGWDTKLIPNVVSPSD